MVDECKKFMTKMYKQVYHRHLDYIERAHLEHGDTHFGNILFSDDWDVDKNPVVSNIGDSHPINFVDWGIWKDYVPAENANHQRSRGVNQSHDQLPYAMC